MKLNYKISSVFFHEVEEMTQAWLGGISGWKGAREKHFTRHVKVEFDIVQQLLVKKEFVNTLLECYCIKILHGRTRFFLVFAFNA